MRHELYSFEQDLATTLSRPPLPEEKEDLRRLYIYYWRVKEALASVAEELVCDTDSDGRSPPSRTTTTTTGAARTSQPSSLNSQVVGSTASKHNKIRASCDGVVVERKRHLLLQDRAEHDENTAPLQSLPAKGQGNQMSSKPSCVKIEKKRHLAPRAPLAVERGDENAAATLQSSSRHLAARAPTAVDCRSDEKRSSISTWQVHETSPPKMSLASFHALHAVAERGEDVALQASTSAWQGLQRSPKMQARQGNQTAPTLSAAIERQRHLAPRAAATGCGGEKNATTAPRSPRSSCGSKRGEEQRPKTQVAPHPPRGGVRHWR